MHYLRCTTILLLLLAAVGCDIIPGGSTTVRGNIRDAVTGLPIDSIYVALNPPGTIEPLVYGFSDEAGAFSLTASQGTVAGFRVNDPPPGRFEFFNPEYLPFLATRIDNGRSNTINVELNRTDQ